MVKLLSCKTIVECEHIHTDTGEVLITFLDLRDISSIYECSSSDKNKYGDCYHVDVPVSQWTIKGNIRELVSFWNEYLRTHTKLILN